jgi:hypothetical protein
MKNMKRLDLMIVYALRVMRKSFLETARCAVILLIVAGFFSCVKQSSSVKSEDEFCSYVNVENIDKTISFINNFLSGLSDNLDDTQKLQALVEYLKSFPCIVDASILCASCIKTLPLQSEIVISFKEDGAVKELILDISMSNPLRAYHYHEMY